ncbi:DUF1987 domain-containing protein [Sulfurimonas sp. SAG-AH-194-I05]|nr:DUF1987 domain-containing protein [Sulfurimonas sp. SAG-AH-194-I05]MDF1874519.1 DUF1987 domain-containing protein [Sulfurimonas sp. SAG-AH-194-I05]
MKDLHLDATAYTPEINLQVNGIISFVGKSYPENTFEFYTPIMKWLEDYFDGSTPEETVVNLELVYFNSSSAKLFFDFFDLLDEAKDEHSIVVHWIYDEENDSAQEAGEDFIEDFSDLTIKLIQK